jgi:hypothetical protein
VVVMGCIGAPAVCGEPRTVADAPVGGSRDGCIGNVRPKTGRRTDFPSCGRSDGVVISTVRNVPHAGRHSGGLLPSDRGVNNMGKRLCMVAILLGAVGLVTDNASAAGPALSIRALRTRIYVLRPGDPEVVQTGQLSDTVSTDRLIVLFIGTGAAKLTVADADATGDTITASGELRTVFPTTFNVSATSPAQIEQNLLVTSFGLLMTDIRYSSLVNGTPATYFYKLKF